MVLNPANFFTLPPQKVEMLLLLMLVIAAMYDIRYRRIPNWLTIAGVILGLAINWFLGPPEAGILLSVTGLLVAFGLYFVLYSIRAMGAGDVKLMAAVGAMVGWQRWLGIFFVTAILGAILALLLIAARKRTKKTLWNVGFILSELKHGRPAYLGREELDVRSRKGLGLPHGAVIALSAIFYHAICLRLSR